MRPSVFMKSASSTPSTWLFERKAVKVVAAVVEPPAAGTAVGGGSATAMETFDEASNSRSVTQGYGDAAGSHALNSERFRKRRSPSQVGGTGASSSTIPDPYETRNACASALASC